MKSVSFNKEVLSLVNELASINQSIKLFKDNGKVVIKTQNPQETIAYILTTEDMSFDFDGDEIAFYNYTDFYKWISTLNATSMSQDDNGMLQIGNGRQKGLYQTSDTDIVKGGRFDIDFGEPDATLVLSVDDLKELQKLRSLVAKEGTNLKISFSEKTAHIEISSTESNNVVETDIALERTVEEDFSLRISDEFLSTIPTKYSYRVDVLQAGLVRLSMNNDIGVDVEIYIAEVEE